MFHLILISTSVITEKNLPFPFITSLIINNSKSEHIKTYHFSDSNTELPPCINFDLEEDITPVNIFHENNIQSPKKELNITSNKRDLTYLPFKKRFLSLSDKEFFGCVQKKVCKKSFEIETELQEADLYKETNETVDLNSKDPKIIINHSMELKYLKLDIKDDIKKEWKDATERSDETLNDIFEVSNFFNLFLIDFLKNFEIDNEIFRILKKTLVEKEDLFNYINTLYKVEELIKTSPCTPKLSKYKLSDEKETKIRKKLDEFKPRNPKQKVEISSILSPKHVILSTEKSLKRRLGISRKIAKEYFENYLINEISEFEDGLDSFIVFIYFYVSLMKKELLYNSATPLYFLNLIRRYIVFNTNYRNEHWYGLEKNEVFQIFKIILKLTNFQISYSRLNKTDYLCEKFYNIRLKIQNSSFVDRNLQRELISLLGSVYPFYFRKTPLNSLENNLDSTHKNEELKLICELLGSTFIGIGLIIFDKRK